MVQTSGYGKYLGKLKLTIDARGEISDFEGNPILMDKNVGEDPELKAVVKQYAEEVIINNYIYKKFATFREIKCMHKNLRKQYAKKT